MSPLPIPHFHSTDLTLIWCNVSSTSNSLPSCSHYIPPEDPHHLPLLEQAMDTGQLAQSGLCRIPPLLLQQEEQYLHHTYDTYHHLENVFVLHPFDQHI